MHLHVDPEEQNQHHDPEQVPAHPVHTCLHFSSGSPAGSLRLPARTFSGPTMRVLVRLSFELRLALWTAEQIGLAFVLDFDVRLVAVDFTSTHRVVVEHGASFFDA
jgi:hypothetical protein